MIKYSFKIFILAILTFFLVYSGISFADNQESIELFFINPLENKKPLNKCNNNSCKTLVGLINNAKNSIDFAIYGIGDQDAIFNALVNAKKRGVKLRGVTDVTIKNRNPYKDTNKLMEILGMVKTDYSEELKTLNSLPDNYKHSFFGYIMHNKFFVFDKKVVWTGSTNISNTCMSYNSNVSTLIYSNQLADLYTKEFEQMYDDKFHKSKDFIGATEKIILADNTKLSLYFSPKSATLKNGILPFINSAQNYLYVPIFYLSNDKIIQALIDAKNRGVDVKIILDANSAANYSKPQILRDASVALKVENWGGKMHMKSVIMDDKYIIIGFTNFTNSAIYQNDENLLVIENEKLAKVFKDEFLKLWESIPDKYLYQTPKAESPESIGSCFDGVDNDHDRKIDLEDEDCKEFFKHGKKYIYYLNHILRRGDLPNFQTDE